MHSILYAFGALTNYYQDCSATYVIDADIAVEGPCCLRSAMNAGSVAPLAGAVTALGVLKLRTRVDSFELID